jgi:hypothetical protein
LILANYEWNSLDWPWQQHMLRLLPSDGPHKGQESMGDIQTLNFAVSNEPNKTMQKSSVLRIIEEIYLQSYFLQVRYRLLIN